MSLSGPGALAEGPQGLARPAEVRVVVGRLEGSPNSVVCLLVAWLLVVCLLVGVHAAVVGVWADCPSNRTKKKVRTENSARSRS